MYDAVNRGFKRSTGEILAYLNCDEQYLPGALKAVGDYFQAHPEVDVVFSDTVVTDAQGNYTCHRYALVPRKYQLHVRLPILTCSLFVRRRVLYDLGIWLDTQWRDLGDYVWVSDMVKRRLRFGVLDYFTAAFADTGENMNLKPNALRERKVRWKNVPPWIRTFQHAFVAVYRLRLAARGSLFEKPFDYSLYTLANPAQRVTMRAARPTSFWKGRR